MAQATCCPGAWNRRRKRRCPLGKLIDLPGDHHFVTFSTYQRRRFLVPERACDIVVEVLDSCLKNHRSYCHGFVVMPNHVYAILTVDVSSSIARFLLAWEKTSSYRIKRLFVRAFSHYHNLCPEACPIWQAGFYDFNLGSTDKFQEKLDYMHNNPVAARLTTTMLDWKWS